MIYLIGSIILTAYLTISFKICERLGINTQRTIVINYLVAFATGLVMARDVPPAGEVMKMDWLPWAVLMGAIFVTFFNLIALTVKKNGVAVASVATKLSLVIPFIFSVILYNEPAGFIKLAGVLIALVGVVLTCYPKGGFRSAGILLLPGIVFIGTGLLDTIIKYTEQRFVQPANQDIYLATCFGFAFLAGLVVMITRMIRLGERLHWKEILAGIAIGIPNYFSIWCLVKVLKEFPADSSVILPVNNIGILLVGTLVAAFAFKERLSAVNITGIILAVGAIILISVSL